jgi:hypothetical protein
MRKNRPIRNEEDLFVDEPQVGLPTLPKGGRELILGREAVLYKEELDAAKQLAHLHAPPPVCHQVSFPTPFHEIKATAIVGALVSCSGYPDKIRRRE